MSSDGIYVGLVPTSRISNCQALKEVLEAQKAELNRRNWCLVLCLAT